MPRKKKALFNAERQKAFGDRMRARGFIRVVVWAKPRDAALIRETATRLEEISYMDTE